MCFFTNALINIESTNDGHTYIIHLQYELMKRREWNLKRWLSYLLLNIKFEKCHPYNKIYIKSRELY